MLGNSTMQYGALHTVHNACKNTCMHNHALQAQCMHAMQYTHAAVHCMLENSTMQYTVSIFVYAQFLEQNQTNDKKIPFIHDNKNFN